MYTKLGADPEFFFKNRKGEVVGSETIIPVSTDINYEDFDSNGEGVLIRDGVAAEINPISATCRENLWRNVTASMAAAMEFAQQSDCKVIFDTTVELTPENFDVLSPMSKQFGCVPSANAYGIQTIEEGASSVPVRSAGGHIHIGYKNNADTRNQLVEGTDINTIIKVLDIIAGNTCVLFDQFPGSKERRVNYGRAGEYREKSYGLEYRTLSNFWLRDYRLFGLATGLVRQSIWAIGYDLAETVLGSVNQKDIIDAINNNDKDLAFSNFKKYAPLVANKFRGWNYPIDYFTIGNLTKFIEDGAQFDPKDPWQVFTDDVIGDGFESFISEYN